MPRVILPENPSRSNELLPFSDERWGRIKGHSPGVLSPQADARLRSTILVCWSWLLMQRARLGEGQATAAAIHRPSRRELGDFERLAKGLRMAADAWKQIGDIHDDRLGDIDNYENLEPMALDAERRLAVLRNLGSTTLAIDPWPVFVRKVARCLRQFDLELSWTGGVYEGTKPSWFQKFMAALDENLLGGAGGSKHSLEAFYAEIAKAMRGDENTGKSENKLPDGAR